MQSPPPRPGPLLSRGEGALQPPTGALQAALGRERSLGQGHPRCQLGHLLCRPRPPGGRERLPRSPAASPASARAPGTVCAWRWSSRGGPAQPVTESASLSPPLPLCSALHPDEQHPATEGAAGEDVRGHGGEGGKSPGGGASSCQPGPAPGLPPLPPEVAGWGEGGTGGLPGEVRFGQLRKKYHTVVRVGETCVSCWGASPSGLARATVRGPIAGRRRRRH